MFRRGRVLKVKVELSPDVVGFGRATILESEGTRLFLQLRTAKGEKRNLPKGSRIWFVSDSMDNPFNGLWSTTIISSRVIQGKTALECTRPKFEAHVQRRRFKRLGISCPVRLRGAQLQNFEATARNISRTGLGIEIAEDCAASFTSGHNIDFTLEPSLGPIDAQARVVLARFNWLANKTDVGLEFVNLDEEVTNALDDLLSTLSTQSEAAPEGKDVGAVSGQLSSWLKSTRDNAKFVKAANSKLRELISETDLEELQMETEDDGDADEHVTD